jgi:hypothetical protein
MNTIMTRLVGSRLAHLYGLSQLQKPNHSLQTRIPATKTRPLWSRQNAEKFSITASQQTLCHKGFFCFARKIQQPAHTHKSKMMVLFDIASLLKNVPLAFTIDYILDRMYPAWSGSCPKWPRTKRCSECTKRKDFEICLRTVTSEIYILFDNKMYVNGTDTLMTLSF